MMGYKIIPPVPGVQPAGGGDPFTFINAVSASADAAGTTLDATASLNVQAGDLLVAWCKHEGTNSTFAIDDGAGGNAFTFDAGDEVNHGTGDLNASFGYRLSATANATMTPRFTTDSRPFRGFVVMQFRAAGRTTSKNTSNVGQGTGTVCNSGVITTTGNNGSDTWVICGGAGGYTTWATTGNNEQINAEAATEPAASPSPSTCATFYLIKTATFASGDADFDSNQGVSERWICNIIAFKGT